MRPLECAAVLLVAVGCCDTLQLGYGGVYNSPTAQRYWTERFPGMYARAPNLKKMQDSIDAKAVSNKKKTMTSSYYVYQPTYFGSMYGKKMNNYSTYGRSYYYRDYDGNKMSYLYGKKGYYGDYVGKQKLSYYYGGNLYDRAMIYKKYPMEMSQKENAIP